MSNLHSAKYLQAGTQASDTNRADVPGRKLCVREAARYLGVSKSLLDKRRLTGSGPEYMKIGRRVTYDLRDLEAYAASAKRKNTSAA